MTPNSSANQSEKIAISGELIKFLRSEGHPHIYHRRGEWKAFSYLNNNNGAKFIAFCVSK